jgi:hypothetical protein
VSISLPPKVVDSVVVDVLVRIERLADGVDHIDHILHALAVAVEATFFRVAPDVGHTGITPRTIQKMVEPIHESAAHHVFALGLCHQSAKHNMNSMKLSTASTRLAMTTKSLTESPP